MSQDAVGKQFHLPEVVCGLAGQKAEDEIAHAGINAFLDGADAVFGIAGNAQGAGDVRGAPLRRNIALADMRDSRCQRFIRVVVNGRGLIESPVEPGLGRGATVPPFPAR